MAFPDNSAAYSLTEVEGWTGTALKDEHQMRLCWFRESLVMMPGLSAGCMTRMWTGHMDTDIA